MKDKEVKRAVQTQFARHAAKYVTSESHAKGDDLALLVNWLQPEPHWRVLDVATGGGHVAKKLAPRCAHVYATDFTKNMLAAARDHLEQELGEDRRERVSYVVADAEALPFLDDAFDVVTCRIAAHHFPHPEHFACEVARVLKKGGAFLFIDNVAPEQQKLAGHMNEVERLRDHSHVRCLAVSEWQQLFAAYGLREEKAALSKKTHVFPQWVARTAETAAQRETVAQFILAAERDVRDYFSVTVENGRITSLQIDEWRTLYRKKEG